MPADPSQLIVVLCTVPDEETGGRLARLLVERRLAACVNRLPAVTSTYWWEGEVQSDTEALLVVKTRHELFERLERELSEAHPYEVPEIVALPMTACSGPYATWLVESTGG
ncbi:MAG: divalent-cation tolerance protein CutA [Thermoleophilia bacterium]|nr:divalent-cation tolerance protein CutA [Thermoleophilia bacterium]